MSTATTTKIARADLLELTEAAVVEVLAAPDRPKPTRAEIDKFIEQVRQQDRLAWGGTTQTDGDGVEVCCPARCAGMWSGPVAVSEGVARLAMRWDSKVTSYMRRVLGLKGMGINTPYIMEVV